MPTSAARLNFLLFSLIVALCFLNHSLFASGASATIGQAVTFSVSVEGTAPFSYQWMKDDVPIQGANGSAYGISSLTTSDGGIYAVVVSNSAGTVKSDIALLAISLPPDTGREGGSSGSVSTTLGDTSFEDVYVGNNSYFAYFYGPLTSAWRFTGYAGVTGNNSGFTSGNPISPSGGQVGFVQLNGMISQDVLLDAGTYSISAQVANRANWGEQQSVLVYVDTQYVGTFTGGISYSRVSSNSFTVAAGIHTIAFIGTASTDSTLFLDDISLASTQAGQKVSIGSSGFEHPSAGAGSYFSFIFYPPVVPGVQDWIFSGGAGVTGNSSGYTSGNPNAPEGAQAAFLQSYTAVIAQTIFFPVGGTYTLSFSAAQRGNRNIGPQTGEIYIDNVLVGTVSPKGTAYQTYTYEVSTTQGAHELKFKGTARGDSTLFIDQVSLTLR